MMIYGSAGTNAGGTNCREIMNMIQKTPYRAGDKLPTEKELCEKTGAGRNTVREALKILASRNILEIRQGAGTFVSGKQGVADDPLGFSMVEDHVKLTRDLLQVRIMLEPQIAGLAAQRAKEEDIEKLASILREMELVMEKKEIIRTWIQNFTRKLPNALIIL